MARGLRSSVERIEESHTKEDIAVNKKTLWLSIVSVLALISMVAVACGDDEDEETVAPAAPAPAAPAPAAPAPAAPAPAPAAPAPAAPAEKMGGTLTVALVVIGAPTGLPSKQSGAAGLIAHKLGVAEFQVERKQDLVWQPHLAEKVTLAEDLSKITVKLRKGVQFHMGYGELTTEDLKWSFGDAGLENKESVNHHVGILNALLKPAKILDKYTLEFPMGEFAMNWEWLGLGNTTVHSKKAVDQLGPDKALQTVVGTGPFEVVEWIADNKFVAEAFVDYWDTVPSFDKLIVQEVPEPSTRVALIKTGEVDIIDTVPLSFLKELKQAGMTPITDNRGGVTEGIAFGGNYWQKKYHDRDEAVPVRPGFKPDDDHPWIGDPDDPERMARALKVRQALSMAIDRELINEQVLLGEGRPEYMPFFSAVQSDFPDRWVWPFDPDKAKQLLEEAGYGDGFEIPLYAGQTWRNTEVYEAVVTMWANIGLKPTLVMTAFSAMRPKMVNRELDHPSAFGLGNETLAFDMTHHWFAEASTWTEGDWSPGIEYIKGFEIKEKVDSLPHDKAARIEANLEIGDFIFDNALIIGIVNSPAPLYYNPDRVTGWVLFPMGPTINNLESIVLK